MLKITKLINYTAIARNIHLAPVLDIDQSWRRKMKLPVNPNRESPLTYLPDYSYMGGRPTPLGKNQKKRIIKQRELSSKIVEGIAEIDFAVERFTKSTEKAALERRKMLDSKLKMKGFKLLKKS